MAVRGAMDGDSSIPPDGNETSSAAIDTATAAIDEEGRFLDWSVGAQRLLGYTAEDVTGLSAAALLASGLPPSAWQCLAKRLPWNGRVSLLHRDGGRVDVELLAYPSRGG